MGQHGHGAVREKAQGGEAECAGGALGAPVQDRPGELAGKRRPRQEAHKNMMPEKLHRELLEAAIMHNASAADRREALEAVCRAVN